MALDEARTAAGRASRIRPRRRAAPGPRALRASAARATSQGLSSACSSLAGALVLVTGARVRTRVLGRRAA